MKLFFFFFFFLFHRHVTGNMKNQIHKKKMGHQLTLKVQINRLLDKISNCDNHLDFLRIKSELLYETKKLIQIEEETNGHLRNKRNWRWNELPKDCRKWVATFLHERDVQSMESCCVRWTQSRWVHYNMPDWVFPLPCCQGIWEEKRSCVEKEVHTRCEYAMAVYGFGLSARIAIAQRDQIWVDYYNDLNSPRTRLFVGFPIDVLCSCGPILFVGVAGENSTFLCKINLQIDQSPFCEYPERKEKGIIFPKSYSFIWLETLTLYCMEDIPKNKQQASVDIWVDLPQNEGIMTLQQSINARNHIPDQEVWLRNRKRFVSSMVSYITYFTKIKLELLNNPKIYQGFVYVHPFGNVCKALSATSVKDEEELCVFSVDKQGMGYVSFYKYKCKK